MLSGLKFRHANIADAHFSGKLPSKVHLLTLRPLAAKGNVKILLQGFNNIQNKRLISSVTRLTNDSGDHSRVTGELIINHSDQCSVIDNKIICLVW